MRRDDEDDLPGENGRSWIDDVVVPDDISELDAEVRAWRRERRARLRRERLRRLAERRLFSPLVIVALLVAAGFTGLLVLFQPRRPTAPPTPLATTGVGGSGRQGLLPDLTLRLEDGTSRPLRQYRPAVLALAGPRCGCDALLRDAGQTAIRHRLPFLLVGGKTAPPAAGVSDRVATRAAEPSGALARAYGAAPAAGRPAGAVLVIVRADGTVARVFDRPASVGGLDTELAVLSLRGTAPAR